MPALPVAVICFPHLGSYSREEALSMKSLQFGKTAVTLGSVAAMTTLLVAPSCSSGDGESGADGDRNGNGSGAQDACVSTREFFIQKAWGEVFSQSCLKCHSTDGLAVDRGARFELFPPEYPTFFDANLQTLRALAETTVNGKSVLLRKPIGELDHGGGAQLDPNGTQYQILSQLIERLNGTEECPDTPPSVATFSGVTLLDAPETLRKASLQLVGRLPTEGEASAVAAGGDAALSAAVSKMLEEDAFHVRLKELFNDHLLTDYYYRAYNGAGANVLSNDDFPNSGEAYFDTLEGDERYYANLAVAREPLELISYIVKNDRPLTEMVTADYTVMNEYSAKIFNAEVSEFTEGYEWQEGRIQILRDGELEAYPHAGVLSSPMFLNRYPTTPTNRNRHRAWKVLDLFLATDILRVASRPLEVDETSQLANPTRDEATCVTCHKRIDPIAGAFQSFNDYDQEQYQPGREWHQEMFPPGFGDEVMTVTDYPEGLSWLGERIAQDPRFPRAMTQIAWEAVLGTEPGAYPEPGADAGAFAAWTAEDETLRALDADFVSSGYNFKRVIEGLVMSPYFRAKAAKVGDASDKTLAGLGTGRLLTPEMLGRKISAVLGVNWARSWDRRGYLDTDFLILYGGIDSLNVTKRLKDPNGIMAAVGFRMANEMACQVTSWDFWQPQQDRALFPHVTLAHVPDAETGDSIPGSVAAIKKNIVHLHQRILGEQVSPSGAEVTRTYQLFYDTWKEGRSAIADGLAEEYMQWACRARVNLVTGEEIPGEERLDDDPNYTVRAWRAVVAYLLSDYEFLYE